MQTHPTMVEGVFLVSADIFRDERGFFSTTWSAAEFERCGLTPAFSRSSLSHNALAGTLRGLHYQVHPWEEAKLVSCVRGAIFDVAVDLRPNSPTYRRWTSTTLSSENGFALFIPTGCAHGFQSLADDTLVHYLLTNQYAPDAARTIAWNDPILAIEWPAAERRIMSRKDAGAPCLEA